MGQKMGRKMGRNLLTPCKGYRECEWAVLLVGLPDDELGATAAFLDALQGVGKFRPIFRPIFCPILLVSMLKHLALTSEKRFEVIRRVREVHMLFRFTLVAELAE